MPLDIQGAIGGLGLGNAFGRIRLDTSDVSRGAAAVNTASATIEGDFDRVGRSAARAQSNVAILGRTLSDVNQYMSSGVGAQAAANIRTQSQATNTLNSSFMTLGRTALAIGGTMGLVFGVQNLKRVAQFTLALDETTTAYRRQTVAATNLAGGQANLNELLVAYENASGGAIDEATRLADVTRLQAIGFADSADELTRFITVARGISLATGRQQDYVISELALSIANLSTRRLDQIGLGVEEVNNRIDELRETNSSLTREMAYQEAVLGIAEEKYGDLARSAEAQATGQERARKEAKDLRLQLGLLTGNQIDSGMNDLADSIDAVSFALERGANFAKQFNSQIDAMRAYMPFLTMFISAQPVEVTALKGALGILDTYQKYLQNISDLADEAFYGRPQSSTTGGVLGRGAPGSQIYADEQIEVMEQWAADVADIEQQAAEQRLDATRQYERQRTDAIADYEQTIARDAEDYARRRLRAEQKLTDDIVDVRNDLADREREMLDDYADKVADLRQDSNDRIVEIEESYAKDRLRRERDHRDNLVTAVARLDAFAVREEQLRYAREKQTADENYQERIDKEKDRLDEQLQNQEEAYQKQLRTARESADERIADLRDEFDERRQMEDEDRAIRLQRQAEDHEAQLAEMDRVHAERIAQIDRQAVQERQELDDAFAEQLTELGLHNESWMILQKARQKQALDLFEEWWDDLDDVINQRMLVNAPPQQPDGPARRYALGGYVGRTGPAIVHEGEYVLNPHVTRALDNMMGGISQQKIVSAITTNSRTMSLTIAPGAIQIYAAPGQDEAMIGQIVDNRLMGLLQRVI
jgi:hypothetical protein